MFLLFLAVLLFSCSSSSPELSVATGTVIFEYKDEVSLPETRLAVFASARSDTRRVSTITMRSDLTNYMWKSASPQVFQAGGYYWVGHHNFSPKEDESLPKGRYTFFYKDLAGEEAKMNFMVSYPDEILTASAAEAVELAASSSAMEKRIALYDEDGNIVFFDKPKSAWTDWKQIRREYNVAVKKRYVYCKTDFSVMIFMPVDYWKSEEQ